jgi:tetratricopeptide (TPR) repeat protein
LKKYLIIGTTICVILVLAVAAFYIYQSNSFDSDTNSLKLQTKQNLDSGNYDTAIESASLMTTANPEDIDSLLLLAATYAQKGSAEFKEEEYGQKAIETTNEVLRIDPKNSEAYRIQGYAYEIQNMWARATTAYEKAIQLDPKNASAYANRGHMYDLLGNFESAREDYAKAIELDPNESHALFNLARLEARAENYDMAKELLTRTLEVTTSNGRKAEIYQVLANISLSSKNYGEALAYVNEAISLNPNLPVAYVTRGEIARAELAEKIFKQESIPGFQEKIDDIVADASKATSIYEGQTSAIVLVGKLMVLLAEYTQARDIFEKALTMIDDDISLGLVERTAIRADITNYVKILDENK